MIREACSQCYSRGAACSMFPPSLFLFLFPFLFLSLFFPPHPHSIPLPLYLYLYVSDSVSLSLFSLEFPSSITLSLWSISNEELQARELMHNHRQACLFYVSMYTACCTKLTPRCAPPLHRARITRIASSSQQNAKMDQATQEVVAELLQALQHTR